MNVYVFGNEDLIIDNKAIKIAKSLSKKSENTKFIFIKPNQDFDVEEDTLVILDNVVGIKKVTIFSEKDIDKIRLSSKSSVHDYDLSFQLKYLKKLGKIDKFYIVAIPVE